MTPPVAPRQKPLTWWLFGLALLGFGAVNSVLILTSAPTWMRILAVVIGAAVFILMFVVALRRRARA
jgi:hypothetical protein